MTKFDQLAKKILNEQESNIFYIYEVAASRGEINVLSSRKVKASSLEQAQQIAYNNYKSFQRSDNPEYDEPNEFLEILPSRHNDVGLVIGGEEEYAVVSSKPLDQSQIETYMQEPHEE